MASTDILAVSYTHLDVYKRQIVDTVISIVDGLIDHVDMLVDVYKRQWQHIYGIWGQRE